MHLSQTGPRFDFVDQNGARFTADDYPVRTKQPIMATGKGMLELTAEGGSGPAHPPANSPDLLAGIAGPITPAKAVDIDLGANAAVLVGAPKLTLRYRGTVPAGDEGSGVVRGVGVFNDRPAADSVNSDPEFAAFNDTVAPMLAGPPERVELELVHLFTKT